MLDRLVAERRLPRYRFGEVILVDLVEVAGWLAAHYVPTTGTDWPVGDARLAAWRRQASARRSERIRAGLARR